MKTFLPFLLLAALALSTPASSSAEALDEEEIPIGDCPAAVQKTFREEARGFVIQTVSKDTEDGETTYWAEVMLGGKSYGIDVGEDGTLQEISLLIEDDDVQLVSSPVPVQKTLTEESKGAKLGGLRRESRFGVPVYVAAAELGGKEYVLKVAEDGTLMEKMLLIEEDDVELADCPAAVQKSLGEQSSGGTIGDLTRSAGLGKRVYLATVRTRGKAYDVQVSEDGSLISKSLVEDD